jgi:hypothetical protein
LEHDGPRETGGGGEGEGGGGLGEGGSGDAGWQNVTRVLPVAGSEQ